MGVMKLLGAVGVLLLFAVLVTSVIEGLAAKEDLQSELLNGSLNVSETAKGVGLLSWGMMVTTGAWQNDWLPESVHPKEEYLFILEDMPYLDSTVFIVPILFLLLVLWGVKLFGVRLQGWAVFWFWFVLVFVLIGIVLATYILGYHALQKGGDMLGIGAEKALAIRQEKVDVLSNDGAMWLGVVLFVATLGAWLRWLGVMKSE